ncbi:MAG: hypothetical protein M0Z94_04330 [Dehalococcoidales bacterium]|nr:hypothetical protein [Dehalococcoidales bacterium]
MFLVFDIESIGLHGEAFAVGYVLVDREGRELESGIFACPREQARGQESQRPWVEEHVPRLPLTHSNPRGVRDAFWALWMEMKGRGAQLVSEISWPVQTNFLSACVQDLPAQREKESEMLLYDLSTARLVRGLGSADKEERLPDELPQHNPLADARQTARLFVAALKR